MLHLNQIQILMYTLPGNSPALPAHGSGWEEPLHSRNSAAHMRAVRTGPPRPPLFLGASHHGLLGRGGEAAPQGLELANAEVLTQAASWGGGRLHALAISRGLSSTARQMLGEGSETAPHTPPHRSVHRHERSF